MLYKGAGVDVDLGEKFVRRIKHLVESTFDPRVLTSLGGFSGCYSLERMGHRDPVLVASTDGVGTKLKVWPSWSTGMIRWESISSQCVSMTSSSVVLNPSFLWIIWRRGN
jgi:phosphoribosylaminoimidazole (AIR) synthetase